MREKRLELLSRQHAVVIGIGAIEQLIGTRPAGGTVATPTAAPLTSATLSVLPLSLAATRRRAVLSASATPATPVRLGEREARQQRCRHNP